MQCDARGKVCVDIEMRCAQGQPSSREAAARIVRSECDMKMQKASKSQTACAE
jgi:hypothetical protein